ncbi:MAG TPA: hypothetical protein IAB66_06100 [Candidatus Caccousia avistercoris]|nr:hypothetical protein [Candidatus Caccousia avistercoris]
MAAAVFRSQQRAGAWGTPRLRYEAAYCSRGLAPVRSTKGSPHSWGDGTGTFSSNRGGGMGSLRRA